MSESADILNSALGYAARGWHIFPLAPGEKKPMRESHGVKDASQDRDDVLDAWRNSPASNIGLACGTLSGVVVVDVDKPGAGHRHDGAASLAAAGIDLPPTLSATTPSGGRHYFYLAPEGRDVGNATNVNGFMGVDIRGNGGYVVLAPSVIGGRAYRWDNPGASLAPFPAALLKRESAPVSAPLAERTMNAPNAPAEPNNALDRARRYLAKCDPAVQGAGGHDALLRAATALAVGFDLTDTDALDLLWSDFNPRCTPPWDRSSARDAKDFERKVAEARKCSDKAPGYLLDAEGESEDVLLMRGNEIASRFLAGEEAHARTSAEIGLNEFALRYEHRMALADFHDPVPEDENPDALFRNGWLRRGGGVIFISVSGAGKSVAATQFAECFALGRPWLGIQPVRPLKVSVYQWEDDADEVADFRNNIRKGLYEREDWTPEDAARAEKDIFYHDVTGLAGDEFIHFLAYAQARDKADLIILNPLQSFAGCDISKNAELSRLLRVQLNPILSDPCTPCGCVVVHHTNKVPQNAKDRGAWLDTNSAAYAGAGGAELVNWARAVLVLRPHERAAGFYDLIAAKRGKRLGWVDADGTPTVVKGVAHTEGIMYWREATPEETAAAEAGKRLVDNAEAGRVVDLCRENGGPFPSKKSLVEAIGAAGIARNTRARELVDACIGSGALVQAHAESSSAKRIGTPEQMGGTGTPRIISQEDEELDELPWQHR